jgi:hypothetical protein
VIRSNQASHRSAVPAAAAHKGSSVEWRTAAINVADRVAARKRSKPTQAVSQWCVTCSPGKVEVRYAVHGKSATTTPPRISSDHMWPFLRR